MAQILLSLYKQGGMMKFNYNEYYRSSFVVPTISAVFFLILIVVAILILTNIIPLKRKATPISRLFYAILIVPFFISFFQLSRSYSLIKEKEVDAVSIQGIVQDITNMPFANKYYLNGKVVWSQYIVMDDVKYYCMTADGVKIGDSVEIKYLPTSKYILEMVKI